MKLMRALCIDPGLMHSAAVVVEVHELTAAPPWGIEPVSFNLMPNEELVRALRVRGCGVYGAMVVEVMAGFMPRGDDELATCRWTGRFIEAYLANRDLGDSLPYEVKRQTAKAAVLGTVIGRDTKVRKALIDAYGGEAARKGVKCPTCKGKGWSGRRRPTCEPCDGSGWAVRPNVLKNWTGSHGFAALACAFAAFGPGGPGRELFREGK